MSVPENLDDNIGFMISDVARLYRLLFDRQMQPLGLTRSQWWALTHIYYLEGIRQRELSELLEIDKSAITKLLARLEAKGWISRIVDETDGRARKIVLSKEIYPIIKRIIDLSDILIAQSVSDISPTRMKALFGGIRDLDRKLNEMLADTPEDIARLTREIGAELAEIS